MCNTVVKPGPYILLFIKAQTKYSIVPQTGIRIQIIPLTTPVVVDKDAVSDCSESNVLPVSGGRIDFVVPKLGRKGILEIKTTNILNPIQRQKWDGRIPDNYYIQVLHYLLVTEYDFVELRAQLKSRWKGQIQLNTRDYNIERIDVLEDIEMLKEKEEEFWQKVLKRQRPYLILPEI